MKRKLCIVPKLPALNCDDMEELNVKALSRRKESAGPLTAEAQEADFCVISYPLPFILRLRVLQIVCGISAMVMGSVACIEERQQFNLGLGISAGAVSILAAAVSIHTSRGWGAKKTAVGPIAAGVLWVVAAVLLLALVTQCARTIAMPTRFFSQSIHEDSQHISRDLTVIACVQITISVATLLSAAICARIDISS